MNLFHANTQKEDILLFVFADLSFLFPGDCGAFGGISSPFRGSWGDLLTPTLFLARTLGGEDLIYGLPSIE